MNPLPLAAAGITALSVTGCGNGHLSLFTALGIGGAAWWLVKNRWKENPARMTYRLLGQELIKFYYQKNGNDRTNPQEQAKAFEERIRNFSGDRWDKISFLFSAPDESSRKQIAEVRRLVAARMGNKKTQLIDRQVSVFNVWREMTGIPLRRFSSSDQDALNILLTQLYPDNLVFYRNHRMDRRGRVAWEIDSGFHRNETTQTLRELREQGMVATHYWSSDSIVYLGIFYLTPVEEIPVMGSEPNNPTKFL